MNRFYDEQVHIKINMHYLCMYNVFHMKGKYRVNKNIDHHYECFSVSKKLYMYVYIYFNAILVIKI